MNRINEHGASALPPPRRVLRPTAIGVSAGLLLGAAIAGIGASSATATNVSSPRIVVARLLIASAPTLQAGTAVPVSAIGDLAFATTTRGFGLVNEDQALYPVATANGGKTWRIDGPHLWVAAADAPATVESIGTAGARVAFAYGGGQVVDSTADGGARWWQSLFAETIAAAAKGSSIWLLASGRNAPQPNTSPPIVLYVSRNGGHTWTYSSTLPKLSGITGSLVRPTGSSAYALIGAIAGIPSKAGIVATTDGGRKWSPRPDPCGNVGSTNLSRTEQLAATSVDDLVLACGATPTASNEQQKAVFVSRNGAKSWTLVAATKGLTRKSSAGMLPLEGAVMATGSTHEVAAQTLSWLVLNGPPSNARIDGRPASFAANLLEESANGGVSWKRVTGTVGSQGPERVLTFGTRTLVETYDGLWTTAPKSPWRLLSGSSAPLG